MVNYVVARLVRTLASHHHHHRGTLQVIIVQLHPRLHFARSRNMQDRKRTHAWGVCVRTCEWVCILSFVSVIYELLRQREH